MRRILLALLALFVLGGGLAGLWLFSGHRTVQAFGELVARVETERKVVALTFDDGPTPDHTPQVLALLAEEGVKATFFLTGRETEDNLGEAQAIVAAGHEVGNHSYSHPRLIFMSPGSVAEEIERTDAAIRKAGFTGDIHFRPPYGRKLFVLPWLLAQTDRKTIMWDIEPETDSGLSADEITSIVVENARPGSIVLMHLMYGSRESSRAALPGIIDGLRAKGYDFVTVSELLALDAS